MIPGWIRSTPVCPVRHEDYYLSATGRVLGDSGAVRLFKPDHELP